MSNTVREIAVRLLNEIPDEKIGGVIDYMAFIKSKGENEIFHGLIDASESSIDFWLNEIDDEVWNDL